MKKLFFLLFFILSANAQELSQDFLDSLPDDIRQDLEEKNEKNNLNSQENYRPYLYSSKLRQTEEFLILKDRLEKDLLQLERRITNQDIEEDIKLYGLNFFNTFQTSFMPINEPNPDSGYTLDIGDVLKIQLVGQQNYLEDFKIVGDGSISIPDIGNIIIAGLTISEASELIKLRIGVTFIATEAYITLAEIRDVNVLVSGNALNPGVYTLTGNSNILQAIFAAGGISEFGSLREINLIRDNNIIETLDIYDILIEGKYNLRKRLRSGDIVFVEARKNIVTIDGAVNRPAKYELTKEQNLYSIINYANGIKKTADRENISLERLLDGTLKTIPVKNDIQFKTIKAEDGDLIYVREYPYRSAKVSGAVLKPGTYTMAAGESLNDLIDKAGGFTDNSYPFGAIYLNENAKLVSKKSKELLYEEFLDNIIAASQQGLDVSPVIRLIEEIKNTDTNGRIVIDMFNENSSSMQTIQDGDELFIPEKNNVVYVYGEISSEGAVMYSDNQTVDYFVDKSGGYKKYADNQSIYVLHPNGESQLYSAKRNIFENSPKKEIKIYPGSTIFVPRELDESTPKRLAAQAYVSILGNLGIALASLSSISD